VPDVEVDAVRDERDLAAPAHEADVLEDSRRDDGEPVGEAVRHLGEQLDEGEPRRARDPLEARLLERDPVDLERDAEAERPEQEHERSARGVIGHVDGVRPPRERDEDDEERRRHGVEVRSEAPSDRGRVDDPRAPGETVGPPPDAAEVGRQEHHVVAAPRELAGERELADRLRIVVAEVPVADVEDAHRPAA
jgi:hypothetical protein